MPWLPAWSTYVLHLWCVSCQILPHSCPNPPWAALAAPARGVSDPVSGAHHGRARCSPVVGGCPAAMADAGSRAQVATAMSPLPLWHCNKAMFKGTVRVRCEHFCSCTNSHSSRSRKGPLPARKPHLSSLTTGLPQMIISAVIRQLSWSACKHVAD